MRLLHAIYFAALGVATGLLLLTMSNTGPAPWLALVPLGVWLLGYYLKQRSLMTLTFVLFVVLVAQAAYRDSQPLVLVLIMLSAYVYWDIESFAARLAYYDDAEAHRKIENRPNLIRHHLFATGGIVVGALILSLITLNSTLEIGFWPAVTLSAVLAIALTLAMRYLREGDL